MRTLPKATWLLTTIVIFVSLVSILMGQADDDRVSETNATATATARAPVQGMTISCPTYGWEWGTDEMVATMAELKELGVTWIAIHPYVGIRNDGTVMNRRGALDPADPPEWITRPIAEAHRLGMKIMIKPHIAYWGSRFSWRGEIEFDSPEAWDRFFSGYEAYVVSLAEISKDADAFVVGTELDRTLHHEDEWRSIIEKIDTHFEGPLTYAANWTDYERVPFWDALDIIGIQAYFPLLSTSEFDPLSSEPPALEDLERGWDRVLGRLRKYAESQRREIVFTELGYDMCATAPLEPWKSRTDGPNGAMIQERCMRAALSKIAEDDIVCGAFLWKWFPGSRIQGDFVMADPRMQSLISDHWAAPVPATPSEQGSADAESDAVLNP